MNPTQIWVVVCKDIATGQYHIFRNITSDKDELDRFVKYFATVQLFIGHNFLGYDYPVISALTGIHVDDISTRTLDTLILSKLIDYPRGKHSIEDYGNEFGYPKIKFSDFSKYSKEMEEYCVRDVDICQLIYKKYIRYINDPKRQKAILLEHQFQLVANDLHNNGFAFNVKKAEKLLADMEAELVKLDAAILSEFKPVSRLVREVHPKITKHGTISLSSIPLAIRRVENGDLSSYSGDAPFSFIEWKEFNPASHKQIIEVLNKAGWQPKEKTDTHKDLEREYNQLKRQVKSDRSLDTRILEVYTKLENAKRTGWKVNETNLATLPETAPSPARTLAKRIQYESRRRTLTEWLGLVQPDNRIHGKFYGIGAWTHRMAHQEPNTANIANEYDTEGRVKLLGKEMRQLWQAPRNRLLVGVDAEGIQLRVFAHYVDNEKLTHALVNGDKSKKTDPHSYNKSVLGDVCKTRQAAKRFIYALFLGAGMDQLALILECSKQEAEEAYRKMLDEYPGFQTLKETVIPQDAKRGWFEGLDGRAVKIPGDTVGNRRHLAMSGYLQNGEAVIMKLATIKWYQKLQSDPELAHRWKIVNFVHDEWQTEVPNDVQLALRLASFQADALREVGEELNLKCPMAGSYWNDDHKDYTIGTNWYQTH